MPDCVSQDVGQKFKMEPCQVLDLCLLAHDQGRLQQLIF